MKVNYSISIKGFDEPSDFVDTWSKRYLRSSNEPKYGNNINHVLDNETCFTKLFEWKNGTGDTIYEPKLNVVKGFYNEVAVLKNLQADFSWEVFETIFEPIKSATIWKIFLLHLINPEEFPIYDQHVFRFYK
ncbi:MAG: hypothetical protein ACHQIM_09940, partial [Sphingobacteriales bacterium]